jgi:hypothetical protein
LLVLFTVLGYRSKYAPACSSEKFTGMQQLLAVNIEDQKCDMYVCNWAFAGIGTEEQLFN